MVAALALVLVGSAAADDPWTPLADTRAAARIDSGVRVYRTGVGVAWAGLAVSGIGFVTTVYTRTAPVGVLPIATFVGEVMFLGGAGATLAIGVPCLVSGANTARAGLRAVGVDAPGALGVAAAGFGVGGGVLLVAATLAGSPGAALVGIGALCVSGGLASGQMRRLGPALDATLAVAPWSASGGHGVAVAGRW